MDENFIKAQFDSREKEVLELVLSSLEIDLSTYNLTHYENQDYENTVSILIENPRLNPVLANILAKFKTAEQLNSSQKYYEIVYLKKLCTEKEYLDVSLRLFKIIIYELLVKPKNYSREEFESIQTEAIQYIEQDQFVNNSYSVEKVKPMELFTMLGLVSSDFPTKNQILMKELGNATNSFNNLPLSQVIQFFSGLYLERNHSDEPYLTEFDFIQFIKKAFCKNSKIGRINMNVSNLDKKYIKGLFHRFYSISKDKTHIKTLRKDYLELLTESFIQFNNYSKENQNFSCLTPDDMKKNKLLDSCYINAFE